MPNRRLDVWTIVLFLVVLLGTAKAMKVKSTAFEDGDPIPSRYTALGRDVSPEIQWKKVPEGTKSLALIVDDPDAPDPKAPTRVWVHWVVYNIPPETKKLPQGCFAKNDKRGSEGLNDWNKVGYMGPDPPVGRHRYYFTLYALDIVLDKFRSPPTKAQLQAAIEGHVREEARMIGTFEK